MIFRCQVFPHPKLTDPLKGLSGQERMESLRRMFHDTCDLLRSKRGLSAAPAASGSSRPNEERFAVDPTLVEGRAGLRGVTEITVTCAEDGVKMETAATDGFDIDALYPVIAVCFQVYDVWREGIEGRSFYDDLARAMRVDWLVLGYEVEYEEGDRFDP